MCRPGRVVALPAAGLHVLAAQHQLVEVGHLEGRVIELGAILAVREEQVVVIGGAFAAHEIAGVLRPVGEPEIQPVEVERRSLRGALLGDAEDDVADADGLGAAVRVDRPVEPRPVAVQVDFRKRDGGGRPVAEPEGDGEAGLVAAVQGAVGIARRPSRSLASSAPMASRASVESTPHTVSRSVDPGVGSGRQRRVVRRPQDDRLVFLGPENSRRSRRIRASSRPQSAKYRISGVEVLHPIDQRFNALNRHLSAPEATIRCYRRPMARRCRRRGP